MDVHKQRAGLVSR
jgi:hypothetical protein